MDYESYLPEIDIENAMRRLRNNLKLYKLVLDSFDPENHILELNKAIASGNPDSVASAAHALKGVAANLSLTRINDLAKEIEMAARQGNIESEKMQGLEAEIDGARKKIARFKEEIA